MHRRNYGRRSGVLVDTCRSHGIWFDPEELEAVLRWIRSGGEPAAGTGEKLPKRAEEGTGRLFSVTETAGGIAPGRSLLDLFLDWLTSDMPAV